MFFVYCELESFTLTGRPDRATYPPAVANKDEPIYGFTAKWEERESVCVPLSPRHHSINREALILRDCHAKQVNYISNGTTDGKASRAAAGRVSLGWNKATQPEPERRLILIRTTVIQSRYPQSEGHRVRPVDGRLFEKRHKKYGKSW